MGGKCPHRKCIGEKCSTTSKTVWREIFRIPGNTRGVTRHEESGSCIYRGH